MSSGRYEQRGVSADKSEVHKAIKNLDKGLFPNAFCKILPDVVAGDADYCNLMHADTAGTKTSLAYLYWKETGDLDVWEGIVQDALVMNIDDMACSGCTNGFIVSSTIGRNKTLVPGEVLETLIGAAPKFAAMLAGHGVQMHLAGGETADVGDIVRTADVGFTVFARMKKADVIDISIKEGDYIVGFAGYGQAQYESSYNGGMGSNGLTSARHDVFSSEYREKYPETFDPALPSTLVYTGSKKLTDTIEIEGQSISLGKLVLSPTRTFLPLLARIIPAMKAQIHGIIHNTGGGLYKVEKFIPEGLCAVKDNVLPVPPLFQVIQQESGSTTQEMFRVFNMGTRLEIYTPDHAAALTMIQMADELGIKADIIGRVEKSTGESVKIIAQ
ncbi:MAG: phosphoribosylformylglycinamidine cyclo-ligase [Saprospiraceae bacterium]|nr:phosphoribosylformylglycinamidine cyclo-ligase [Saprospiraceae bacterium]